MNLDQTVVQVHIEDIIPNRFQPRLNFDQSSLQELADSIKVHGIIQPFRHPFLDDISKSGTDFNGVCRNLRYCCGKKESQAR